MEQIPNWMVRCTIGNSVGINLMFRFITTTDDQQLLMKRLYNLKYYPKPLPAFRSVHPDTIPPIRHTMDNPGIPVIEYYLRLWPLNREEF